MINKIAIAVFALASVLAAPQAAAYEQVCMFGKPGIGYYAKFRLVWGVPHEDEIWRKAKLRFPQSGTGNNLAAGGFHSRGATHWSPDFHLGGRKCVNLDEVPEGQNFLVQVQDYPINSAAFWCVGWENDRGRRQIGVLTNSAENRGKTLHMDAWGSRYAPLCRPVRVE